MNKGFCEKCNSLVEYYVKEIDTIVEIKGKKYFNDTNRNSSFRTCEMWTWTPNSTIARIQHRLG